LVLFYDILVKNHCKENIAVPANHQLANQLVKTGKHLMKKGAIRICLDDPGHQHRRTTNNKAFRTSYSRSSNDVMVHHDDDIRPVKNFALDQILRNGWRTEGETTRLCTSYTIFALIMAAFHCPNICPSKDGVNNPISISEVVCGHNRVVPNGVTTEDFNDKYGSIKIDEGHEFAKLIFEDDLKVRNCLFVEGKDPFTALMSVIHNNCHIVHSLSDEDLNMLDKENNYLIGRNGAYKTFDAFIVKNSENGNITLVYHFSQLSTLLAGVSVSSCCL
jgi:hypothetical protein